jgi:D-alanine-D-alanine ligase
VKRLRVLVVVHSSLVPPDSLQGLDPRQIQDWRAEYDVITTLRASGHQVQVLGVLDSLVELRAIITEWQPDVVFNLLEEFDGIVSYDQHVIAFLEMLRQPYTGCNPRGLMISRDKALCKQIFAYHRIPTPHHVVLRRGHRLRLPRNLRYPLFVKSSTDDASLGIAQASIVEDEERLRERVEFVFEQNKSDVLVEEFIDGRECYVGVLGNERLRRLPVWELNFGTLPANQATIATRKIKWDLAYRSRHGIGSGPAESLPAPLAAQLDKLASRIYRCLGLSGFARMDFRLAADGSVYVLEANANPHLAAHEDFARSAAAAGLGYAALLERLLALGLAYRSPWRVLYG